MSPQTGPDLVSAGYPISSPLSALLGGNDNLTQTNVPIKTNLSFGFGCLKDGAAQASPAGSVYAVAVPVSPGDVFTKVSFMVGATGNASANVTNLWAALYTGTGSAPGTTGAQPTLIASAQYGSVAGSIALSPVTRTDFSFATPQTILASQAPYGFVYAAFSVTTSSATQSFISMTCAASGARQWYSTSPFNAFLTSNGGTGSAVPTAIGTAVPAADPPICFLS